MTHDTHDTHDQTSSIIHEDTRAILDLTHNAFVDPENPWHEVACDAWLITRINVPHSHRGKGIGRHLISQAIMLADANGYPLALVPVSTGGLSQDSLEKWYERNGFEPAGERREALWLRPVQEP